MASDEACIYEASGNPEAQQVLTFLEAHGIPCFLRGESMHHLGFTLDGLGLVRICVTADNAEKARDLLARAEAGELNLSDAEILGVADPEPEPSSGTPSA